MLEKLIFKIGDKDIELTKLEAYQLQGELNELLGHPNPILIPYIVPETQPVYPWYEPTTVFSETTGEIYINN